MLALGALVAALGVGPALAVQIQYEPDSLGLVPGTVPFGFGTVLGSGGTNCGLCGAGDGAQTMDFWRLVGDANQRIIITGTRLDPALDLAFAVFTGETTADYSARNNVRIYRDGSVLGLGVLAVGDDELAPPNPGDPYGDPRVILTLPYTGVYTIAVSAGIGGGTCSGSGGTCDYILSLEASTLVEDVPEPSTYAMLLVGLAGMAGAARYRKAKR